MNTGRPGQKKQVSRKGKKAWRKNIDLEDFEQGREDVRDAEIVLGAGPLFEVDTKGSEKELTHAMKQEKKLKSHEILHKRSAVPALGSTHKKKDAPKKKAKLHDLLRKTGRTGEDTAKVAIETDGLNKSNAFDLWDEPAPATSRTRRRAEAPQAPIQDAASVELPHAGKSYNPSKEDWRELIAAEHSRLEKIEQEREAVEAEEARIQALIAEAEQASEDEHESSSEEEIEPFSGRLSVNPVAENKKKTKTQRNKERRHAAQLKLHQRLRELKKQAAELEKLRESDFDLLKPVKGEGPKKYRGLKSKYPVMEAPLEVKLSDEIEGSLRRLVPEGNLAKDRFRSLQTRGVIESRIPVKTKRRYPQVVKEKWTFKDFNKDRVHGKE